MEKRPIPTDLQRNLQTIIGRRIRGLHCPNPSLLKRKVNRRWYMAIGRVTREGTGTLDAHCGRMQERKTEVTTQPANIFRIRCLPFGEEEESQVLIDNRSRCAHTTWGREDQGTKAPMLNLPYTFFILASLGSFMLAIRIGPVGRGERVNIRTSKTVGWYRQPQKPNTLMSRCAPGSVLAEARERDSPESGWREGSVEKLWQTSDNRATVMSRTSLWQIEGKAPFGQLRACSTLLDLPQTQCEGRWGGDQPYQRATASQNAPLRKAKPWHSRGKAVS